MTPVVRRLRDRGVTLIRKVYEGAPAGSINLGLGQPTDPFPEIVRDACVAMAEERSAPYGPTAGLSELRQTISQRAYTDAGADSVLVTAGTQEALWVALMGLVEAGEEVMVPEPSYPAYRLVTELIGARPVSLPLRFEQRWRLDIDAVRQAWSDNMRAIVIGSPSNPTGMIAASSEELAAIHALCRERQAWMIVDEIYAQLRYGGSAKAAIASLDGLGERVIAINGVSKTFSCMGFRVGWLHADPGIVDGLMPLHQQVALCASIFGQRAALACLSLWDESYFASLNLRYEPRRTAALEALQQIDQIRFHEPEGGFYVFVDVSAYASDTFDLALRLRDQAGVITAPGEAFGPSTAGYLRLSFADDANRVGEGVRRIGDFLRSQ